MTRDRVQALEQIGFVWDSQTSVWRQRLRELVAYQQTYGHCNVPASFVENPRLAAWVKCQRRQYRLFQDGKPSNITQQRIEELNGWGFEWDVRVRKRQRTI